VSLQRCRACNWITGSLRPEIYPQYAVNNLAYCASFSRPQAIAFSTRVQTCSQPTLSVALLAPDVFILSATEFPENEKLP
jgi:hypothetical protein